VRVTPNGRHAVSRCYALKVWDLETGACRHTYETKGGGIWQFDLTSDGRLIVCLFGDYDVPDKKIQVLSVDSGECIAAYECDVPIFDVFNFGRVICAKTATGESLIIDVCGIESDPNLNPTA
jgi:hypothetical protein